MNKNIRVFLVQRLRQPLINAPPVMSTFNFGGGLKNGGISKEGMDLIKNIFDFEYMGSAEFEWGAVPKALERLFETKSKAAFENEVETKEGNKKTVYIICDSNIKEAVTDWIKNKGFEEYNKLYRTKEYVGLQDVINGKDYTKTCGWFELDSGFFFFTDKEMFDKSKKLFGIE